MKVAFFLFLALLAVKAHAQDGTSFSIGPYDMPDAPTRTLVPTRKPDPRYPLQVQMTSGRWFYNGNHESKGDGSLKLLSDQTRFWFRYRCAWSFELHHKTYAARWIKPGEKLEILLRKPGSDHTTSCALKTHA